VTASLYQRLGGAAAVAAVVDDAVDRHAANPTLAPLFCGQDLPQLKALGVSFLSAGAGEPGHEPGPAGVRQHVGMSFSPAQWQAVVGDITESLCELGIGAAEVGEDVNLLNASASARKDSRTRHA
jgi:hemoglobin